MKSDKLRFRCNICAKDNRVPIAEFGREEPSCRRCGSTVRMRSIIHVLTMELFGESLAIDDIPVRPEVRGLGMSDWLGYALRLPHRLGYQNTFLGEDPKLDILDPDPALLGSLDFLISTDVFEHVVPPVRAAFVNSRRLLKPGGVFVFSVPYFLEGETREHFPELHEFRIEDRDGGQTLINQTADGREQEFGDLVFHGGPGQTLEIRMFSLVDLRQHFAAAGFDEPRIYADDADECGMIWHVDQSLTMAVRAPAS